MPDGGGSISTRSGPHGEGGVDRLDNDVRRGFFPLKLDWIKDGAGDFMGDRGGVGCVGFGLGYVHNQFPFFGLDLHHHGLHCGRKYDVRKHK
jgi:hypothetical protein